MSEYAKKIAELSPEKRALLMMRLKKKGTDGIKTQAIQRRKDPTVFPMSFAQERMWFLDRWQPGSPLYNISAVLRITGQLDEAALVHTLTTIFERHQILRVRFTTEEGRPVQQIIEKCPLPWSVIDLSGIPAEERELQMQLLATKETQRSFDLGIGPLIRFTLLRLDKNDRVLILVMHHIISDGWSVGVLIREVTTIYGAMMSNMPNPLPELPIQYPDFAQWQREWLTGDVLARQLDYWKNQMDSSNTILELPVDHPRPAEQSYNGSHIRFVLSKDLSESLKSLSKAEEVTLFMTMLAAFKILLYRYTGQEDISIGSAIANRNHSEIEGLVGLFVNTLVLRTMLGGTSSFREILNRVREVALGAFAHQDVPFEKLVEEIQPERDLSHTPLFQVMFDLQKAPLAALEIPGVKFSIVETENETSKFDLVLMMVDEPDGITGMFEYNKDIFDASTIQRMITHFQNLLQGLVSAPTTPISLLPILNKSEQDEILFAWNDCTTDYPKDRCVQEIFESIVANSPDTIAVSYDTETLTYRELNLRANKLAHYLRNHGVNPNDPVTIFMERSPALIVGILGILKAGGFYVPLDTAYPKPRLAMMLEDTASPVLITQKSLVPELPDFQNHILSMDTDWDKINQESDENLSRKTTSASIAYVIYTSGSTGTPKGVAVPHYAINRLVLNTNYIQVKVTDRIAQVSNASFDAATFEIWGALLTGATLVGITRDLVLSSHEFVRQIKAQRITIMFLTTALFNQIANEIPDAFATLKTLKFGGEACDPGAIRQVLENDPPERLLHVYGPTESTTYSNWFLIRHVDREAVTVPIGKPISNTTCYVLDKNLAVVPAGVPGELYIGGDGLALGYFKRPGITAEKFIPDPFSSQPGSRLYRTGDLVRSLPGGAIEFIGRIDYQVKIRGFRIELGEIESVLKKHDEIKDVVVLARADTPGDKRLVAYIVPEPGATASTGELRKFMLEKLPDYMVPSSFVTLKALPINPNGKVDRKALPVPDQSRPDLGKPYVPPRTELERFLASSWQEILGIDKIGIFDNFFELGGNSILAAVFINKIQKKFGETAHVSSIFMAPTISEFSMYVNEYYPDLVSQYFGEDSSDILISQSRQKIFTKVDRIDRAKITKLKEIIPILQPFPGIMVKRAKNPPAIFLLSPPRSGSTLFRVMLAGNPRLFAPPELDLLSFNTLGERARAFSSDQFKLWLEATQRAIMEIKQCDVAKAQKIMTDCENQDLSIKEFYGLLQEWIGDKILVDKTPSYPLDLEILKRAEMYFDNALYIHLTRHPYATIYSFLEAKLDQNFFRYPHPFTRRELAELIWIICHENILEFLKDIPRERQYRLKFEDLITQPEPVVHEICQFLNVDYYPEMLEPYKGQRMTDGVTAKSQMVGDFKFYLHRNIDSNSADRWKRFHTEDFLSNLSWQIAEALDYEKPGEIERMVETSDRQWTRKLLTELKPISREGELPLSFQQQRLWFLDQFEPGSPSYNVPLAVRLIGPLQALAVEQSLNDIVRRHEVLRTNFLTIDGKPVLKIAPALKLEVQYIDITLFPKAEREIEAQRQAVRESRMPFDLANDPLIRARLLKLDQDNHVVLLTMHHIVSDGWSAGILIKEFGERYAAGISGKPFPCFDLPVQYVDYAHWQRQWLKEEVLQSQLNYWRHQLSGAPPLLELPTDRPRPAEVTYNGASMRVTLPYELTQAVKALGRQAEVTSFMTLLAALQVLLARYSGQTDICVGTPIANRGRSEIENLIGFFVNTLVLRSNLAGNPDFKTLLKRVRETALGAFGHQNFPFEMLVDELHPERNMSHTPLFQVMFAFQDTLMGELKLPELVIRPYQTQSVTAKFDITLSILEKQGEFRGAIEYNTDLFDESTIKRMMNHFQVLLENIVATPDQPITTLPILSKPEQYQILDEWNRTGVRYPADRCIHQLFEDRVNQVPDAAAVVYGNEKLTFRELNQLGNQLAHRLRSSGVGADGIVGLCVERSLELMIGIIGILKAGGAYLPLDPSYPPERLAYIMTDAGVPVLVTQRSLGVKLPAERTTIIYLDADKEDIGKESDENPVNQTNPDNLAYVIYTSGSTGKPKGVMIQHRSAINLFTGLLHAIYVNHPGEQLRVSLNAPLPFDASVQQLVMLLQGHTLYIVPQDVRGDGNTLLAYIRQNQLNVLDCVPSQLKLLLTAGLLDNSGWTPNALLPGGEAIDEVTWRTLAQAEGIEFYNMYGPTECTVDSTICRVKMVPEKPTIGRPITNAKMYILDPDLQPVPIGVFGELHIGGDGLARGYLNRPELTAEKFVPDLFSTQPGVRMYKTGDRVRYLPDGNIDFQGRIDYQVKVRGFRIELGEIEAILRQHAELQEAVVIVREDMPGEKRLVAYYVPPTESGPSVSDLRQYLKTQLPDYMIPSVFVKLAALPLTPNRKVDRRALPVPDQSRPELSGEYVAPQTPEQEKLAQIWQQVLGLEKIGVYDNFFELGGDSILSIQVISKANQAGLRLSPKLLFQYPTIAGLAAVAGTAAAIQAEQGVVVGPVPLTPIQHQFFEQQLSEPQHWNQAVLLEIKQGLDTAIVQEVVRELLQHHDALRLRFQQHDDAWRQYNAGLDSNVPFNVQDLSNLSISEQKAAIESHAEQLQKNLDIVFGPLLQVAYFDLGPVRPGRLLMVCHHLAVDAVSWRILLEDFQTAYEQLKRGKAALLPAKTTSFRQWAKRLVEYARSEDLQKELNYWTGICEQELPEIPVDCPTGANTEALAQNVQVTLGTKETTALLQEVPKAYGTEINDILLTALVQAFAFWTGDRTLLLELEGHGRENIFEDVDVSRTVGWFTTTYPVYLNLAHVHDPGTAIKTIKEQLRQVPDRGIGFGILRYLNDQVKNEQLTSYPHPEVAFNYLGRLDQALPETSMFSLAQESSGPTHSPRGVRIHLLDINSSITAGQLQVTWTYSRELYQRSTIEGLANNYLKALIAVIEHCQSIDLGMYTPSDFPDVELSQDEIENLMTELEN